MTVPRNLVGAVIGRQGSVIKKVRKCLFVWFELGWCQSFPAIPS